MDNSVHFSLSLLSGKEQEMENMDIIIETLRSLGLSGKYKGYYYLVEAIQIILQMDVQPFCVTKDIYPPIATRHRIKTDSVESGIRQMARYCWENSCVVLC